ncbi:hypothetical protein EMIT0347P_40642 [Pseudomonas sp. IT-347P]
MAGGIPGIAVRPAVGHQGPDLRQAPEQTVDPGRTLTWRPAQSIVGVSLLAIAHYQTPHQWQADRYREQAHSYRGLRLCLRKAPKVHVYGKLRDHKHQFRDPEPSAGSRDGIKRCQVCVPRMGIDPLCVGTTVPALSA